MAIHEKDLTIDKPGFIHGKQWILNDLNHITVLFGKNGSGKSVILRTLLSGVNDSRHLATPERAGDITPDPGYATEEASPVQRAAQRQQNQLGNYRNRAMSRLQTLMQQRGYYLKPGHGDDSIEEVQSLMKDLLPDFTFKVLPASPFYELLRPDGSKVTSASQVSSGEVGMLTLGVDLVTMCTIWQLEARPKRMLLIDEPDTHLHPDLQEYLAGFLVRLMRKYDVQVIIATHSTTLLAALGFHGKAETSAVYLSASDAPQHAIKFDEYLQTLSSVLGGHALMGPLFSAPLLLVEGDDDYRIWSQAPRHHVLKLAVLPCDGSANLGKYQKHLEDIFESLRTKATTPAGYALLDGDVKLPDPKTVPQKHVPFIQLACRESENLFLTGQVLAVLGVTWDQARTKIKTEAHRFGEKKAALEACDGWDRKKDDIKGLINELSLILDPKNIHWTKLVGSAIGTSTPNGEMADFLGAAVMVAFWP